MVATSAVRIGESGNGAGTARTRTGSASKAMRGSRDRAAVQGVEMVEIPDGRCARAIRGERNFEHLIKIAIVDLTVPANADEAASHEAGDGGGIEMVHEQTHVSVEIAGIVQLMGEARDRHVGDR